MNGASQPPLKNLAAAAAGGFGGAVLGVIAATNMMGDGGGDKGQAANEAITPQAVEVVAANPDE